MKTYSIIITIALIACLAIIFWPPSPSTEDQSLLNQRDSFLLENKRIQARYDLKALHVEKLKGELLDSKAVVKRSEEKLTKAKANEKVYLRRIKTLSLSMSEVQADSAIMERFKDDPDSIHQKVFVKLANGDECDSIRQLQTGTIQSLQVALSKSGSLSFHLSEMDQISRGQVSDLQDASLVDDQVINNQDKEIKKLKRRNKVLKIIAPVAVVLTVLILI